MPRDNRRIRHASKSPPSSRRPGELSLRLGPDPPDRFTRQNITLLNLLNDAYDMRAFRILGGPEWVRAARWDVSAKAERAVGPQEMRLLVQRLLQDRFALKTHIETRDQPLYELVKAREDGRLGPGIKPAEFDCEPIYTGQRPRSDVPVDASTG